MNHDASFNLFICFFLTSSPVKIQSSHILKNVKNKNGTAHQFGNIKWQVSRTSFLKSFTENSFSSSKSVKADSASWRKKHFSNTQHMTCFPANPMWNPCSTGCLSASNEHQSCRCLRGCPALQLTDPFSQITCNTRCLFQTCPGILTSISRAVLLLWVHLQCDGSATHFQF